MKLNASQIAAWSSGRVEGPDREFSGLEAMDLAQGEHLTFVNTNFYARKLADSPAGGALAKEGLSVRKRPDQVLIWVPDADLAVAKVLEQLAPPLDLPPVGIDPSACIDPTAQLGAGTRIGPHVIVGPGAVIGEGSTLMAGVYIGREVVLGADCQLWPHVTVRERCRIGARVILHPGCVIGADGFGYRQDRGRHVKIPHIGTVEIGDDCELGANTTVDRGKFSATRIGAGSKLDNLVQIGHNVRLGQHSLLVSHVAIGGSVRAGNYLVMGGGSVISDHVELGQGVQVGGFSAVVDPMPDGSRVVGIPAIDGKTFFSQMRATHQLPKLIQTIQKLQERVTQLESASENHRS